MQFRPSRSATKLEGEQKRTKIDFIVIHPSLFFSAPLNCIRSDGLGHKTKKLFHVFLLENFYKIFYKNFKEIFIIFSKHEKMTKNSDFSVFSKKWFLAQLFFDEKK